MTGGIIQIVTYGTQDLYLTGNPEISYFKVVYRRHTNFSMETIRVQFQDETHFGEMSTLLIPKNGDLIHKIALCVSVPEVDLKKGTDAGQYDDVTIQDDQAVIDEILTDPGTLAAELDKVHTVDDFMRLNMDAYRRALIIYRSENGDDIVDEMKIAITEAFPNTGETDLIVSNFNQLISAVSTLPTFNSVSLQEIADTYAGDDKEELKVLLDNGVLRSTNVVTHFENTTREIRAQLADAQSENIKFAWVDRLGHSLIDYVEIDIGGQTIDKHYGDWLNVWYELTKHDQKQDIYNKMIGDVVELTNFDRAVKPKYELRIPLQFWFCRHNGLSLPLVALEFHDVIIRVKFKRLEQCCYVEKDRLINIPGQGDDFFLDELGTGRILTMDAHLDVDYVYLDSAERKRFAQVSHEYLIEDVQMIEYPDVQLTDFTTTVDFFHPTKEFIWNVQKQSYQNNTDGFNRCRWGNYGVQDDGTENSMLMGGIEFHGYDRVPFFDSVYYNSLQPYHSHSASPVPGIYCYSFSLIPEEHQPSGSANCSRLSSIRFSMMIDSRMFANDDKVTIRIYARSINILRITSGMAGTAYTVK